MKHPRSLPTVLSRDEVLLGHAQLTTTTLYSRVATRTVRNVISPLDRLRKFPGAQAARDD